MIAQLVDPANYAFNPYAVPTFTAAAVMLILGMTVLIRERATLVSVSFLMMAMTIGVWLVGFSMMYTATDQEVGLWWARSAYVGVPLIPAAVYHFAVVVLGLSAHRRPLVMMAWCLAAVLAGASVLTGALIEDLYRYWWGYYPRLRWLSVPLLTFFFGMMILTLAEYAVAYRRAEPGVHQLRARSLLIAFSIGYLGSVDYLACFGFAVYPFGYAPIWGFTFVVARTIRRYRLVDLTPSFASKQILATMGDPLIVCDTQRKIQVVNRAACSTFGYGVRDLIGLPIERLAGPGDGQEGLRRVLAGAPVQDKETVLRTIDGECVDVSVSISHLSNEGGAPQGWVIIARDIRDRKRAAAALRRETAFVHLLQDVAIAANEASSVDDAFQTCLTKVCLQMGWAIGHVFYLTSGDGAERRLVPTRLWHLEGPDRFEVFRRVTEALSFEPGKGLPGRVLASRQPAWIRDVTVDDNFPRANQARACGIRAGFAFPVWVGKEVVAVLEFFSTEISDPDPAFLTVMANIGTQLGRVVERKRTEERLSYIANYDPLTGLPNRGLCLDRLRDELVRSRWQERFVAVLFLDLDRFKNVNDTLGHSLGDQLLKAVADRLVGCVRAGDTVARLGGDEFVVILRDMARPEDAVPVAQKILDSLARPFVVAEVELFLTTSIGISLAPADGADPETLLKNADTAMYRAKDLGKNTFQLYTADMNFHVFENMELETNLRRALERREFELHYQPVVDLRSRRLVGAEALVRWRQPDGTLMPPAKFIPVAEETGLIVPLGEWVLRTACGQSKAWRANGNPGIRVAVNLSARQFHRRGLLTEQVARALEQTGLEADGLGVELTESVLMQTGDATIDALRALHAMGIPIALDDFGTGYSSLSYLKRFPIATVKIDRSFVHDITIDRDDAAIVTAIITMAHSLKLNVVAEGVETAEQLARLKVLGCDQVQGYLLSRPLPAEEMAAWLVDGPVGGPWLGAVGS